MQRLLYGAIIALCAQSAVAAAPTGRWNGHQTTLADAKIACIDLSADTCTPFIAQGIGMADYIIKEHPDLKCAKMNGQDLTRLALILSEKTFQFWSDALIASTKSICKLP
jgi:hypothetical protein